MKLNIKSNKILALASALVLTSSIMASSMIALTNNTSNKFLPMTNAYAEDPAATEPETTEPPKIEMPENATMATENSAGLNSHDYDLSQKTILDPMKTFAGNEKATDLSAFGGNTMEQCKYKMYCVYRSMGMTKVQACAALGSAACEGGFHPEIIEYATPSAVELETGGHTHGEVAGAYGSLENKNAYIDRWSQYVLDPEMRTKFTDDTMRSYGVGEGTIEQKHNGVQLGSVGTNRGFSLAIDYYYDTDGLGTTGCGLYGFTGGALYRLFDWAAQFDMEWYEEDAQLSYLIAQYSIGGYSEGTSDNKSIRKYINDTKDMGTPTECIPAWCAIIGWTSDSWKAARAQKAEEIYSQITGDGWDDDYGKKILRMAEAEDWIVNSDDIVDEGVVQHHATPAALYPRNSGYLIDIVSNDDIYEASSDVFKEYVSAYQSTGGHSSKTYSLYELFGEDLHWYRYFGEATYVPKLMDHVWSAYDQEKLDKLLLHPIATIRYEAYNYLSCNVYPGRPEVLTKEDLDNGEKDPRVVAIDKGFFNGMDYVLGSFQMGVAKGFVSMVAFLSGNTVLDETVKVLEKLEETDVWEYFRNLIMIVVAFAMMAFIISIAMKAKKYAVGTGSARDVLTRFFVGVLCLGMVFAGAANPKLLNSGIKHTVGVIDTIFNAALTKQISNDEVIAVTDPDKATQAALWRTAIFNAWCRGQFDGLEYEELYTQFAGNGGKMPQSHDQIDYTDTSGNPFFDSASLTGDVFVPVGGGKEIRNWAAYLYSCGSKYHIDSTIDMTTAANVDLSGKVYFPNDTLKTTAGNPDLAADLFRVIDAQMNISPQYYASGGEINNYTSGRPLNPHYLRESTIMLVNAALLLFLVPVLYKKIASFILLMITIAKMIYFSIIELFKESAGLGDFGRSVQKHTVDYFVSCLKLCLMTELYYDFVDKGFFMSAMYCVICFVILGFTPREMSRTIDRAYNNVKRIARNNGLSK